MPFLGSRSPSDLRDELARQTDILARERLFRMVAVLLAFAISAKFLPLWLIACSALIVVLGEISLHMLGRAPDRTQEPSRHRALLLGAFMTESGFALPPAVMWHSEDEFVKAFAVGMIVCSMLHIATVRSIHLPMALTGAAAISLMTLGSNMLYWLPRNDPGALALTTVCALVAITYSLRAIVVTNRLHRETVTGRSEAQAANAAKDRFLAQMSHELRTPLNAILGMGHAELRRASDPLSRERLSVLITSAQGLSTILDDILDMSAVQEGRLPIRPRAVNPRDEIAATVALFRPSIEEAGLKLIVDLAPDLPARARLDPQRLRQCLSNLLSNALKHTGKGSIDVTAAMIPTPRGAILRIEIGDSGGGVATDQLTSIFEPFSRGAAVNAPLGNGLGLSISRALARQMGGDLWVMPTRPGQRGARFALTLAVEVLDAAAVAWAAPMPTPSGALAGCLVLVVDDIATNRLVAVAYLHLFGARTLEAPGGPEALALVAVHPVDVILLDMNMPGMDGVQTFRALRALPGRAARIPVVAMTADALEDQRAAYLAEGIDGYVAKPLAPDSIAEELRRVLNGSAVKNHPVQLA